MQQSAKVVGYAAYSDKTECRFKYIIETIGAHSDEQAGRESVTCFERRMARQLKEENLLESVR